MTSKQGLLLLDEKVLTAKRLAFRNLLRLGFGLFAPDDHSDVSGLRKDCLEQVSRISGLQQTKESSVSLGQFLEYLPEYFGKVLTDVFPQEKQANLANFLGYVGLEAKQCVSIVDDCNRWLARLRDHGADYMARNVSVPVSIPATPLCFDVDDKQMLDAAGGKTTQKAGPAERAIEVCFNPTDFSFPSYFSTLFSPTNSGVMVSADFEFTPKFGPCRRKRSGAAIPAISGKRVGWISFNRSFWIGNWTGL